MKKEADNSPERRTGAKRTRSYLVVILNVILLACAALLYGRYAAAYQERLQEENLGNIANLNRSAAGNATALIESWDVKLEDILRYAGRHGATYEQMLEYLDDTNSSEDRQFQLIGGDYTGHQARREADGAFLPLSYAGSSYRELQQRVFDDVRDEATGSIRFAPEFTDGSTALKYFAMYRHLTLESESGAPAPYTLLLAARSRDVLSVLNRQDGFASQSTVLIDAAGNYIVSNDAFKSDNFFQYLYVYNDLTLDQRNGIQQEMANRGSGELYYQNAVGEACVFRYEQMPADNWCCVTCVPLSSFRTPTFSVNYAIYAVLALLLMLGVDVLWLRYMNRILRVSMQREKEASEAKTDFLSRMSHDIRTPLNGIIGLTALAADETDPAKTREYLENVQVSGQFLLGLVNDILDMSRVESGRIELHPEPCRDEEFCRYVDAVIAPLCRDKELAFTVTPPEDRQPVLLDRLRFNQVFFNLLSNAVKFTPAGGRIELFWDKAALPDGRVALDFTVRDNGIGMSEAFQQHMFEAFSQESPTMANTGTGLGLSIAWNLVKLMGGSIEVESEQGVGTAIRVHLTAATCESETVSAATDGRADLAGRRILLCEDNPINTMVARNLLQKWGARVETAANGKIGLERFQASAPGTYDAILMDILMPEMDGYEATRAIRGLERADARTVPIIAMTANAYDSDVRDCLNAGMNAHVGKPVDPKRLRSLLAALTAASGDGDAAQAPEEAP